MSLLTSHTPGGITTNVERSARPTPRQLMQNSRRAMFTMDSTCFDIFPVLWVTSLSPTSSIQCGSACLTTCRSRFSPSWRCTNGSTSTMQSGYPCLLTMTSHQKELIWGCFAMEWEADEGNELVPAWSGNPVSTRQKPRSASHIQSCNWMRTGSVQFYMHTRYKSHYDATLSYLEVAMHCF